MRIAISPDENPGDPGSASADGIAERTVNLRVAGALLAVLERCRQDVWFDDSLTFVDRVAQANRDGTQLLVAVAHNSSTPGASGTQFVFCFPDGQTFGRQAAAADAVYAELAKLPGWPARRKDAVENIYECCSFDGDTVYVELLFMSPEDQRIWSRADYAGAAAEAIARGLASAYGFPFVEGADDMTPAEHQLLVDVHTGMGTLVSFDPGQPPPLAFQLRDLIQAGSAAAAREFDTLAAAVATLQGAGIPPPVLQPVLDSLGRLSAHLGVPPPATT